MTTRKKYKVAVTTTLADRVICEKCGTLMDRQSNKSGTCGKHRAAGRQHHRRYYLWGIGNHWQTYGAAGRGDAKTVHRRLPCIATILGRSKRRGGERGGQTGRHFVVACYAERL